MLPVMARTTEDILNLVPRMQLRESGLAIRRPRWKVALASSAGGARRAHYWGERSAVGPRRRRDGAAPLHGVEQPLLDDRVSSDRRAFGRPGRRT